MDKIEADLSGQNCLITGASSGIGEAAACALSGMGAALVLVCRNQERGEASVERIQKQTGNHRVELLIADLSSLDQVRQTAQTFLDSNRPLHILLNNAGVFMQRREETVDGFETSFAVNHLAPFLLTNLLLERMKQSAPARIVSVASAAHTWVGKGLDFDDLQSERRFRMQEVYGKSKLANILFTRELARRLEGTGVTTNCMHPGAVGTRLGFNNGFLATLLMGVARPFLRSAEQGADTAVYLCAAAEAAETNGEYFVDRKRRWPKRYAQNDEDARRLWEVSEKLTGLA